MNSNLHASLHDILDKNKIMVIDGSMSTALEALGCDLNNKLWTATALNEAPELIKRVHMDYLRAGADCGITCSYQASIPGLMNAGYSLSEAEALITRSVDIFLEARDEWWTNEADTSKRSYPLCLAAVGPYGAYLADGSEYRGRYTITDEELKDFHYRRMELLHKAGADMLLIETQPSMREVRIVSEIAESLDTDYWVSFSCLDGKHINEGDLIRDCAAELKDGHPHLKMIGVNCTAPKFISELIDELHSACDIPIAVYPNSGESYDPVTKTWHGNADGISFGEYALSWMQHGAKAVGGCCQTVAHHIKDVAEARDRFNKMIQLR